MSDSRKEYAILLLLFPALLVAVNTRLALSYCLCFRILTSAASMPLEMTGDKHRNSLPYVLLLTWVKLWNVVSIAFLFLIEGYIFARERSEHVYDLVLRLLVCLASLYIGYRQAKKRNVIAVVMLVSCVMCVPIEARSIYVLPWHIAYLIVGVLYSVLVYRKTVTLEYEL